MRLSKPLMLLVAIAGTYTKALAGGVCVLAFALTAGGICKLLLTGNGAAAGDFVSYWAAGHQLAHHANPYGGPALLRLERAAGFPSTNPVFIMRNPPPALLLALPLGFTDLRAGALLWSTLLLACLVVSVFVLWTMHGRPKNRRHFLGYTFGPALACLLAGQTALFALLGLVLFLRLHRTRPFWAGVSLWLCAIKPHLFLPFGAVLLAWILVSRSYKVLIGAALALAASCAIALALDPLAWAHYVQMMRSSGVEHEFIPCLSIALRGCRPDSPWLQYLLPALSCAWALHYFWIRRHTWDWMEHGALLMLVSLAAAPYAWITDQAIAIPALLQAAWRACSHRMIAVLALASAVIEIQLQLRGVSWHSAFWLWTAPAWLVWFLYATSGQSRSHDASARGQRWNSAQQPASSH